MLVGFCLLILCSDSMKVFAFWEHTTAYARKSVAKIGNLYPLPLVKGELHSLCSCPLSPVILWWGTPEPALLQGGDQTALVSPHRAGVDGGLIPSTLSASPSKVSRCSPVLDSTNNNQVTEYTWFSCTAITTISFIELGCCLDELRSQLLLEGSDSKVEIWWKEHLWNPGAVSVFSVVTSTRHQPNLQWDPHLSS